MNEVVANLEAALDFWNLQLQSAIESDAPEDEIELVRITRKLVAKQLSEAQFSNDDTVRIPVQVSPLNMRFIEVNKTYDYFPEDDE